jgi:hypothetical protein
MNMKKYNIIMTLYVHDTYIVLIHAIKMWWKMFSNIFVTWLNRFCRLDSLKYWNIGPFDKLLCSACHAVTLRLIFAHEKDLYPCISQIPLGIYFLSLPRNFMSFIFFLALKKLFIFNLLPFTAWDFFERTFFGIFIKFVTLKVFQCWFIY